MDNNSPCKVCGTWIDDGNFKKGAYLCHNCIDKAPEAPLFVVRGRSGITFYNVERIEKGIYEHNEVTYTTRKSAKEALKKRKENHSFEDFYISEKDI